MEAAVCGVVDEVVRDGHVVGVHQADPGRREEVVTGVGHDVVADLHVLGALGAAYVHVHPPAHDDAGGGQVVEEVAGDGDVLGPGQQLQAAAAHLAHGVVGEGDVAGVGQLDLTGHLAAVAVLVRIVEGVVRVLRLRLRATDEPVTRQQPVAVLERDAVERDRARLRGRAGPGHVHQCLHRRYVRPGLVDVLSRPRVVEHLVRRPVQVPLAGGVQLLERVQHVERVVVVQREAVVAVQPRLEMRLRQAHPLVGAARADVHDREVVDLEADRDVQQPNVADVGVRRNTGRRELHAVVGAGRPLRVGRRVGDRCLVEEAVAHDALAHCQLSAPVTDVELPEVVGVARRLRHVGHEVRPVGYLFPARDGLTTVNDGRLTRIRLVDDLEPVGTRVRLAQAEGGRPGIPAPAQADVEVGLHLPVEPVLSDVVPGPFQGRPGLIR